MRALLVLIPIFISSFSFAEEVAGMRPGYLSTVRGERQLRDVEMVLIPAPEPLPASLMGRPFLDAKLSREFQDQYELKFGRTDAERNFDGINRFTFYEYPGGQQESVQAYNNRQRDFGQYMFRRLTEHHVDQYFKSNPELRPVYELKDRIANVDVKVSKGYKVHLNYSYSGNYLDAKLENPYDVGSKLTFQMGEGVGPSRVQRTILTLGYPVSKRSTVAFYEEYDREASTSLVGSRVLTRTLSTSVTLANNALVNREGPDTSVRHNLVLVGLSWTE